MVNRSYRDTQQLLAHYGFDRFLAPRCRDRLVAILRTVDSGQRISEEDVVWLFSQGREYFSSALRDAYHRLEAGFFAGEFTKTRDPWMAVNASGHYRKCNRARDAESLLCTVNIEQQKSRRLQSALCTTYGGVMRDLGDWPEALNRGLEAHSLSPDDYRPCTLIGAIHMQTGNYSLGQEWDAAAVERGASIHSVDQDLRSIFFRADQATQAEMREFLLGEDPVRYAWAAP